MQNLLATFTISQNARRVDWEIIHKMKIDLYETDEPNRFRTSIEVSFYFDEDKYEFGNVIALDEIVLDDIMGDYCPVSFDSRATDYYLEILTDYLTLIHFSPKNTSLNIVRECMKFNIDNDCRIEHNIENGVNTVNLLIPVHKYLDGYIRYSEIKGTIYDVNKLRFDETALHLDATLQLDETSDEDRSETILEYTLDSLL